MIDITMTTTLRPGIIDRTLKTFCENLFTKPDDYRLIFNIDLVGENIDPMEVVKVCNSYFSNIKYKISKEPHFGKAFKWCWEQTRTEYVFHMNEDWELLLYVDINHMLDIMKRNESNPTLSEIFLKIFEGTFHPEGWKILPFLETINEKAKVKPCLYVLLSERIEQIF